MEIQRRETLPDYQERRRIRESAGLTTTQLAAMIGVSTNTIYNWETRSAPKGPSRTAYADALKGLEQLG